MFTNSNARITEDEPPIALRSLSDATIGFLEHCRVAKGLALNTLRAYASDLAHARRVLGGETVVTAIDREAVREYVRRLLDDERRKETTAKRRIATLKVFFRWLEREEVVPISVFHRLDLSIRLPRRLPRALEADEMRRLLRCATSNTSGTTGTTYDRRLLHFVLVALFTTGLRISELVSLETHHVSLNDGALRVRGKGNRERRVFLAGRGALQVLSGFARTRKKVSSTSDLFLVTEYGSPVTAAYVRRKLRALARTAKIGRVVTPHMLRHTAATQLLEAGVDIRFVQKLLGHSSIATTQIYTQVRDGALKDKLMRANTLARLIRGGG